MAAALPEVRSAILELQRQMQRLREKIERERLLLAKLPELSVRILDHVRDHGRITIGDALKDIVCGRSPDPFDWLHPASARSAGCFAFASPSWIHG